MRAPFWLRHPIRSVRMRLIPPCARCAHRSFDFGHVHCRCPAYIEHIDKTECVFIRYGDAIDVRGGNYCRFSPREDK